MSHLESTVSSAPRYVVGGPRGEIFAHFASGVVVRAGRSRERRYPGLIGAAPPTLPFYSALGAIAGRGRHCLDVGSGSGEGTRLLGELFDEVTGIDCDGTAIAYSREFAPRAQFHRSQLHAPVECPPAQAAVICDVLGLARSPEEVLTSTRAMLAPEARVVVAEPAAHPTQRLMQPARRAFTPDGLEALLARTGYEVRGWLYREGTFVACMAEPCDEELAGLGVAARRASAARDLPVAAALWQRLADSARGALRCEALIGLADALREAGDGDGAARVLLGARDQWPSSTRPHLELARLALRAGDVETALRLALDGARCDPADAAGARCVWLAARDAGHPQALEALRAAVSLAPDDAELVTALAGLAAEHGDYAYGISLFERLRAYDGELGAGFHVTLAWLLLAADRRSDARLEARLARALAPQDPSVTELCAAIGDPE